MFEFDEKPKIEICGKSYECDPSDSDFIEAVQENFPKIIALQRDLSDLQKSNFNVKEVALQYTENVCAKNKELLFACKNFLQGCLGIEEYNDIFSTRRPNSVEHIKLCTYIYEWIMTEREKMYEPYLAEDNDAADNASGKDTGA